MGGSLFSLLGPGSRSLFLFGASGAIPVFAYNRWWTVLSAGWLHGGALHILFNIMWIRQLGPAVGDMYGAARMIIIYTIAGVAGFLLSSVAGEYSAAAVPPRRAVHDRRVGADLRPARRARALRPPRRQQPGPGRGDALRRDPLRHGPDHAGRRGRQLRPRGRLRRRLPREHVARSAEARADGPFRRRGDLPGRHRPRDSLVDRQRLLL